METVSSNLAGELMSIHDHVALAEQAMSNDPAIEQHETFMQASAVFREQGARILRLIAQLEQTK